MTKLKFWESRQHQALLWDQYAKRFSSPRRPPRRHLLFGSQVEGNEVVLGVKEKEIRQRILFTKAMKLLKSTAKSKQTYEKLMEELEDINRNLEK